MYVLWGRGVGLRVYWLKGIQETLFFGEFVDVDFAKVYRGFGVNVLVFV